MSGNIRNTSDLDNFLANGGNINEQNHLGLTILHKAVVTNNTVMIDHIITKSGVDYNIKDSLGKRPIQYSANEATALKLYNQGSVLNDSDCNNEVCQALFLKSKRIP